MIPYGRQNISQEDIDAVLGVLRSDFLTQGPAVPAFEDAVKQRCGARHAVAVNSATGALHIACMALGVGPSDVVWTSPVTFVASANCARYCGADVDFVDIDPRTYNMSVERLGEKLAAARQVDRLPKVVIPVHMTGQSCDMAAIRALSREYGFAVIEDASHAVGATYGGQPVGGAQLSDIVVFSFHPVKIVTTGEGGIALTNDDQLARKMEMLRTHGIIRPPAPTSRVPDGPWYYEQVALGYNYRLTDLQAALGLSQLRRLDEFVECRRAIAHRYYNLLEGLPVTRPWQSPGGESAWHLYVIQVGEGSRLDHREVFEFLRSAGVGVNLHYIPVYLQPYYAALGFAPGYCAEAERYYARAISLPMFPGLTEAQQDHVAASLRAAVGPG